MEGTGGFVKDLREQRNKSVGIQPGVDMLHPGLLAGDAEKGDQSGGDQSCKGTGTCSALPVKAQRDDNARTAPDGAGDGKEHQNIVDLGKEQTEEEGEDGHTGDRTAQGIDLLFGGEGLFTQRNHKVLNDDGPPGVHVSCICGDHQEDHQRTEDTGDAVGRQHLTDRQRHQHLSVNGAECLGNLLAAVGFAQNFTGDGFVGIGIFCGPGGVILVFFAEFASGRNLLVGLFENGAFFDILGTGSHVIKGLDGQLVTDLAGFLRKILVVEEGENRDGEEDPDHWQHRCSPWSRPRKDVPGTWKEYRMWYRKY